MLITLNDDVLTATTSSTSSHPDGGGGNSADELESKCSCKRDGGGCLAGRRADFCLLMGGEG